MVRIDVASPLTMNRNAQEVDNRNFVSFSSRSVGLPVK